MAIFIDGCVYQIHPLYHLYAASIDGKIIHIIRQVPDAGYKQHNRYLRSNVRKYGEKNRKGYYIHRFVWECYNRLIPDDKVTDHVNDNKDDNRLRNLQIMTQQENCKKSAKKRDYSFAADNRQNRRYVTAINQTTQEVAYFNSMHALQQHLGINAGIVKMVCEGINNCKTVKPAFLR